jgi:putative pyruvate formate lyase activating enzyme
VTRVPRIRVDAQGALEIVDPGFDDVALLRVVDPGFAVRRAPLPGFRRPRLERSRRIGAGVPRGRLAEMDSAGLWDLHGRAMHTRAAAVRRRADEASLLDLKVELARRLLAGCALCARRCRVDRARGERGACGLGVEATVESCFVHVAEEAPINPSLVLNLVGCGLRCRFCQQAALRDPSRAPGTPLDAGLWRHLDARGARSISFVGGDPDESLPAILAFLAAGPPAHLPIAWNSHAYSTPEVLALLDGVVDAYVPDLKYGSGACGLRCSGVPDHPAVALATIAAMLAQGVPVYVRVLVLPGHVDCCHLPALERLAALDRGNLFLSVRGQYAPDGTLDSGDGELVRRPHAAEIQRVVEAAARLRLRSVPVGVPIEGAGTAADAACAGSRP